MVRCERLVALLLSLLPATAVVQSAAAGTDNDVLTVTVTVQSSCSLNGGTLDFGQYNSGQATDLDATGTISFVNCNGNLVFALDGGNSGSVAGRQLRSGTDRLDYQLFRNPTRTAVWGSGLDAREVTLLTPQSGSLQVYGRIPRRQAVPNGTYTDIINIMLTF